MDLVIRVAIAVLAFTLSAGCATPRADRVAPSAVMPPGALDGLPAHRAVAVVTVSTDCPIANGYQPDIERLRARFEPLGIEFLLLYAEVPVSEEEVDAHRARFAIRARAAIDHGRAAQRALGAAVVPEAFVLSPERPDGTREVMYRGRIDDRHPSRASRLPSASSHELEDALASVAAGRRPAVARTDAVGCVLGNPDPAEPAGIDPAALFATACMPCHREGGSAPFTFGQSAAIARKASTVAAVLRDGLMPPDLGARGAVFAIPRLSSDEREAIARWAALGAPMKAVDGEEGHVRSPGGGTALTVASGWTIPADGSFMRSFVADPGPVPARVRAIRMKRASAAVERAMLSFDASGRLRELDAVDPGEGAHVRADAPGRPSGCFAMIGVDSCFELPPGWCIERPDGDIAVELHAVGRGAPMPGEVRFAFEPGDDADRVAEPFIAGPLGAIAGARRERAVEFESSPLVRDASVVGLGLRVDERCASIRLEACAPDGSTRPLLSIPSYREGLDRAWMLAEALDLPAGTTLRLEVGYGDALAARLAQPMVIAWAGGGADRVAGDDMGAWRIDATLESEDARGRTPETGLNWYEAIEACNARSRREGLHPAYELTQPDRRDGRLVRASVRGVPGNGWRLAAAPTASAAPSAAWHWTEGHDGLGARVLVGPQGRRDALPPSATVPGTWAGIARPRMDADGDMGHDEGHVPR